GGAMHPQEGRIAITLNEMRIVDRPDAHAVASGDLALAWRGADATLSGALNLNGADNSVASAPNAGLPHMDVVEINRPDIDDAPIQPPLVMVAHSTAAKLDISIKAPGRVFTRGRGLDAEWSLDMRLTGDSANPRIFGQARAIRGSLSLAARPFDIQSGLITFDGDPGEARIDLIAERDTTDLTARITVSGTAANPDIAFSSTPSLPEDEVLPQSLFGRSVADLSALEAAQLASSLAALSGRSSFSIADAARSLSGLDRLDVRQDENGGGLLVAGGVYLTRDVYVEVARTALGQASSHVEWRIRPQLLLVTSFLGNGDQRVSIRWRREK
ncbi:MAG: translocation/assembly module TamB domain-containing protein, partial [Hyphomonadaceae bacterium]